MRKLPRWISHRRSVLQFEKTRVAFKYVFDCGSAVEPLDAARLLLENDLGIAAVGLGEEDVYVSPRFARVSKTTALMADLADLGEGPTVRRWIRILLRRPRIAVAIALAALRRRTPREGNPTASQSGTWPEKIRAEVEQLHRAIREAPILQQVAKRFDEQRFTPDYLASLPFCRVQLQSVTLREAGQEARTLRSTLSSTDLAP